MIWHTLESFLRRSVLIKGEEIDVRIILSKWEDTRGSHGRYQNIFRASKMMYISDKDESDSGHYITVWPQNVSEDIRELSVKLESSYTGEEFALKYSYSLKDYPDRISVRVMDMPAGAYSLKISAKVHGEPILSEVPILVLGEEEFWRLLSENLGLCQKEKSISSEIAGVISAINEVHGNTDAINLRKMGVNIDWVVDSQLLRQDRKLFHEPVNMWTVYQLLRLVQSQAYEQALFGGSAEVGLAEEEGRLTLKAHLKAASRISERSLEAFSKTVKQLPGLDRVGIFTNPPHDAYIIAKFLIYREALRDRDNNLPVVTIGNLRFDSEFMSYGKSKLYAMTDKKNVMSS